MVLQIRTRICSSILGLVFLTSGFLKAWDAGSFADILIQYGAAWLGAVAPVIILVEVVLGFLLVVLSRPRWTARVGIAFLIVVTLGYAYGVLFRGITDCGCFGSWHALTSRPWLTFVRNGVLVALALPAALCKGESSSPRVAHWVGVTLLAAIACFLCGLSMSESYSLPRWHSTFSPQPISETTMAQHIALPEESEYLVFLFSYTCPHCQNAFANVEQYQKMGLKPIIGVATGTEEQKERFYRLYQPVIDIQTIEPEQMSSITHELPILMYIRRDTIINIEKGTVTSPGLFLP